MITIILLIASTATHPHSERTDIKAGARQSESSCFCSDAVVGALKVHYIRTWTCTHTHVYMSRLFCFQLSRDFRLASSPFPCFRIIATCRAHIVLLPECRVSWVVLHWMVWDNGSSCLVLPCSLSTYSDFSRWKRSISSFSSVVHLGRKLSSSRTRPNMAAPLLFSMCVHVHGSRVLRYIT